MRRIERGLNILKRGWRIYVDPPKESLVYIFPETLPEVFKRMAEVETSQEPKQVAISENGRVFVSCMKGHSLDVFNEDLNLIKKIPFEEQCVEVVVEDDLVFATSTNFSRSPKKPINNLHIFDSQSLEKISSVETKGEWSKVISVHPSKKYAFVSNWHSHNVSVISLEDIKNPQVVQVLSPEKRRDQLESPRGIAFTSDGKIGLLTGFYSHNLLEIRQRENGEFYFDYVSGKLTEGEYGGNPRDIVIHPNNKIAFYSNLGMNTINAWDIEKRKLLNTIKVGKEPNSIALMGDKGEILLVSCRSSRSIYAIDTKSFKILGRSEQTGETPTGLAVKENKILVSDFDSNKLGLYMLDSK